MHLQKEKQLVLYLKNLKDLGCYSEYTLIHYLPVDVASEKEHKMCYSGNRFEEKK